MAYNYIENILKLYPKLYYICSMSNELNQSQMNFSVDTKLKEAFKKAVGSKYMAYRLRKEMERIVKKSNKITHA